MWMYGRIEGLTIAASSPDPKMHTWATVNSTAVRVVMWNRSPNPRLVNLRFPWAAGVHKPAAVRAVLYRVDDTTFKLTAGGDDAVVSGPTVPTPPVEPTVATLAQALAFLATQPLHGESALMLEVAVPDGLAQA